MARVTKMPGAFLDSFSWPAKQANPMDGVSNPDCLRYPQIRTSFDHQFAGSKLEQLRWPVRASIRMIRVVRRTAVWDGAKRRPAGRGTWMYRVTKTSGTFLDSFSWPAKQANPKDRVRHKNAGSIFERLRLRRRPDRARRRKCRAILTPAP